MIEYIPPHGAKGNLLDTDATYIAHGVNCQGVMGKGVALAICTKWPIVKTRYEMFVIDHRRLIDGKSSDLLGEIKGVQVGNKVIFNLFTQDHYGNGGRYLNYEALYVAFERMLEKLPLNPFDRIVAIPRIGCNNAGGDWSIVEPIIRFLAAKHNVLVQVHDWKVK